MGTMEKKMETTTYLLCVRHFDLRIQGSRPFSIHDLWLASVAITSRTQSLEGEESYV